MGNKLILVTGVTGYIGGRLVPRLLEAGYEVCCLTRDEKRLRGKPWFEQVIVNEGDVMHPETLHLPEGIDTAYYLVHSLTRNKEDFVTQDITAAHNFGQAAKAAGVKRIIYLGQLGQPEEGHNPSPYLQARHRAGNALRESGIPVTEFQAGVIVGSGSVTYEMVRYLTERWPFLACPSWAYTLGQPIAVRDVLSYLIGALQVPESKGKWIEIGGPDTLTFAEMMLGYSIERGLARWMIPVRFLTQYLSALWTSMITPISIHVARPLIELMSSNEIVTNDLAQQLFPNIHPIPYHRAVKLAIERIDTSRIETSWSDALVTSMGDTNTPVLLEDTEGFFIIHREKVIDAAPETCYKAFTSLGGETGWLYWDWIWDIRGWMDDIVGGVGLRRGRRHPYDLAVGDPLDFFRVEALEPNHLMRLHAEMKVPGEGWLECRVRTTEDGKSLLKISALFEPRGIGGPLYWYAMAIPHLFIFSGMVRKIGERAEQMEQEINSS